MADLNGQSISTGAQPWAVRVTAGAFLTVVGTSTEATYSTAQTQIMPSPETQFISSKADEDVPTRFRRHLAAWKADARVSASSKLSTMVLNSHYQSIVGMGLAVVPHILAELEARPDHLDQALVAITEENPVPEEAAGKLRQIAQAWLDWGRARGMI